MENATKALLIAAAVLVAIIIISLTLVIVRQGQEAVAGADMTEAEVAQFNSKFNTWNGKKISTTQVNTILSTAFLHNQQEKASGNKRYVYVYVYSTKDSTGYTTSMSVHNIAISKPPKLSGTKYYSVQCNYNGNFIKSLYVRPIT